MEAIESNLIPNPAVDELEKVEDQYAVTDGDKEALDALSVPIPQCECERIKLIRETRLFDTPEEETYDRYVSMASHIFKAPISLISLMDVNRQWFKSKVGLDANSTHRNVAFCAYTILETTPNVMVVHDALEDVRFKENPLVLGPPFIRFYAGAGLLVEGIKVGTLCVIDTQPRQKFGLKEMKMLIDIASIISQLISERRSKVLRMEHEIAQINLSVLYSLKYPLEHVTSLPSPMQIIYKAMKLACHNDPEALRNENTVSELQNTLKKFSTEMDTFHHVVELCLTVASKLLDVNQIYLNDATSTTKKQLKLVTCDFMKIMEKVKMVVMKSNPSCKLDWTVADDLQQPRGGDASATEGPVPMSLTKLHCFSYPNVLTLLFISMLSYLSRKDREVESIAISTAEQGKLAAMTDSQVVELLGGGSTGNKVVELPSEEAAAASTEIAVEVPTSYWYSGDLVLTFDSREAHAKLPSDHYEVNQVEDQYEMIALRNILVWIGGKLSYSLAEDGQGIKYVIQLPAAMEIPSSWMDNLLANPHSFHEIQARYHSKAGGAPHSAYSKAMSTTPSQSIECTDNNKKSDGHNNANVFHAMKDIAKGLWKSLLHGSTSGSSASVHPMSEEDFLRRSQDTTEEADMDVIRTLPEPVTEKQVMKEFQHQEVNLQQLAAAAAASNTDGTVSSKHFLGLEKATSLFVENKSTSAPHQ